MQVAGAVSLRNLQRVQRSGGAHPQRLDAQPHVVDRTRRRSKVEDVVHLTYIKRLTDIDLLEAKLRFVLEMPQVREVSGPKIVDADDFTSLRQQRIAQMRAQKPSRT